MSFFFVFFLFILLIKLTYETWSYFPEDFSSIDYLTNPENENEIHLLSFYANNLISKSADYRNGINIYPIRARDLFNDKCGSISDYYSSTSSYFQNTNDNDNDWKVDYMNNNFFPPKRDILFNFFRNSNPFSLILISPLTLFDSFDSIKNRKFTEELYQNNNIIFNYYIWFTPIIEITDFRIGCINTDSCALSEDSGINYGNFEANKLYQIYFQLKNDEIIYNSIILNCTKTNDYINLIINNINIRIYQIKITYQILSDISCSTNDNCPPGTLCNSNTKLCEKCDGRYAICKDIEIGPNEYIYKEGISTLECSRFTEQWEDPIQNSCKADYFNINKLNYITFEMLPIKTGAASVSFWFYSIKPDPSSNGIFHIVLSDFMICTIIVESNEYEIYVTGYELYHEAYGIKIRDIQNKNDFIAALSNFPYNTLLHLVIFLIIHGLLKVF